MPRTATARAAARATARRRLFEVLAAEQRPVMAAALDDDATGISRIHGNPEAATLLSLIYAIRDAERDRDRRAMLRDMAARRPASVTVVLVERLASPGAAALVVRPVEGAFLNYVLVRESDLSPDVVAKALATLQRSRRAHGEIPRRRIELPVRPATGGPLPEEVRHDAERIVRRLRTAEVRAAEGIATGRVVEAQVGPAR